MFQENDASLLPQLSSKWLLPPATRFPAPKQLFEEASISLFLRLMQPSFSGKGAVSKELRNTNLEPGEADENMAVVVKQPTVPPGDPAAQTSSLFGQEVTLKVQSKPGSCESQVSVLSSKVTWTWKQF